MNARWMVAAVLTLAACGSSEPEPGPEPAPERPAAQEGAPPERTAEGIPFAESIPAEQVGQAPESGARPPQESAVDDMDRALELATAELARQLTALPAGALEGLARVEGQPLVEVGRVINASARRLEVSALRGRLVERLQAGAPGFAIRGGPGFGEEPAAGMYRSGLPLLLVGRVNEERIEYEDRVQIDLTVVLRVVDPLRERVLALALVGRPPEPLAPALPELRKKLQAMAARGWPGGETPCARVGPLRNQSTERLDLERAAVWVEDALRAGGLTLGLGRDARAELESVREAAALDGVEVDPTALLMPTHVLSGELLDGEQGRLEVSLILMGMTDRVPVVSVRTMSRRAQ